MSCRNPVRPYKIETNRYGFASATLDVSDDGHGWKYGFVKCWECRSMFAAVWPRGLKIVPCVFCDNQNVRAR